MKSNVKYIANYLDNWCNEHGSTRIVNITKTTYESINRARKGAQVSLGKLDDYINATGITIAEASIKGKVDDKYKGSSVRYIDSNFERLLRIHGLTATRLSVKLYGKNRRTAPYTGKYPKPQTLQDIANYFEVEVADFFVNPTYNRDVFERVAKKIMQKKMLPEYADSAKDLKTRNRVKIEKTSILSECSEDWAITGIQYIKPRIYEFSNAFKFVVRAEDMETLLDVDVIKAEAIIRKYGFSIGEAIVKKGVRTEWYNDTSAFYLPFNLERIRNERGVSMTEIVRVSDTVKNPSTYLRWENGESYPNLMQVQQLANALNVEIGDLFVTPDGCE